ncbi:uncharacterized protein igsf9b isoform X2 [Thalassophryne amazonica]|uniref:uncharacterized protein igsf9b isoform X2 n=1 Tax=Thalassophryne amazonica TaxID=390379 RepID=UPI001470A973|nr:uncharacterized protein igsf9b isoform X2 [Thalassophryne amazonica]
MSCVKLRRQPDPLYPAPGQRSLKSRVKILVDGTLLIPNLVPEDAGNYTCVPTNGILTPPSASAHLKVKHPARVGRMPRETYLPAGMEGIIVCPVQADPPVLNINWTKDGTNLDLDNFPGWMVNSEGSVFITTANDNAVGMYTCTAYNSYGTMGRSEPTQVILKDPPSFRVRPRPEYLQEVGRDLVIPCVAGGDPAPNITWSKIGSTPRSTYTVLANGSLLLQPLSKDHQGGWECLATNRVATVSAGTVVTVLGTSPHGVSSVSVSTEVNHANVSWVPGFDGGYTQKFTVWVKQASRGKHEWASLPVPTSKTYLLVTGLLAGTSYQFSVLPQNKLGSGPFSEIVSVHTQAVPTEAPAVSTAVPTLDPPVLLSTNRTDQGVLLQWSPPAASSSPLSGYVLQARRDQGQWFIISNSISANQSEALVQGLLRDSNYDLRLMSRSNKILSEPSHSVNISTIGMEVYPVHPGLLEVFPESLLAGVLGGVVFLCVAIVLSLVMACIMSRRRRHRRRKKRQDLPSALLKSTSPVSGLPPHSPDSVLKLKLCPSLPFFPNSSSSQSDQSSFDKDSRGEYQDQKKQLLSNSSPPPHYTVFESHLGSQAPSPTVLESISRGPDGRFIVQPLPESASPSNNKNSKRDILQSNCVTGINRASLRDSPKSSIVSSEQGEKKGSPLTMDVQELSKPPSSPGRVRAMARNFSRHGCFYSDDEQSSENLLERASFYSDNSEKKPSDSLRRYRMLGHTEELLPSLGRRSKLLDRDRPHHSSYQPMDSESALTNTSIVVSQMDSEFERGNIKKCVKLSKEREEMEKALRSYRAFQRGRERDECRHEKTQSPHRAGLRSEEELVWKPQDVQIRQKNRSSGQTNQVADYRRACYFGNTSSPMDQRPVSHLQWDISPVSSVTCLIPTRSPTKSLLRPQHPSTGDVQETTENSLLVGVDSLHSPVTQNTSLPMLSTDASSESPPILQLGTPERARSMSPQRAGYSKSLTKDGQKEKRQDRGIPSQPSTSHGHGTHSWESASRPLPEDNGRHKSPSQCVKNAALYNQPVCTAKQGPSPSGFSALPYDHNNIREKATKRETRGEEDRQSLRFFPDLETEGVRARSRRSDKYLLSDSPSPISALPLVEEPASDQSQFSVQRISGSFKAKPTAASLRMSPQQTSAILEYLSLPGFIEMSVDEPVEEAEVADAVGKISELQTNETVAKPDVVPKSWDVHCQEKQDIYTKQNNPAGAVEANFDACEQQNCRHSHQVEAKHSSHRVKFLDEAKLKSVNPGETRKEIYEEKSQILVGAKNTYRPESRLASRSAQALFSAAKGMADIVSKHSFVDTHESTDQSQQFSQGSKINNIASRICQVPVPYLKKSLSVGPCKTLSGVRQHSPFLKKSISLGAQRWEHFESPRTYISEKCYWDEFPKPDVRVKSYSLGHTPSFLTRPGPSWREYASFRQPSIRSLEGSHHAQRPVASPSYLIPSMYPSRQTSVPIRLEPCDPRRRATIFPATSRWPSSYQDTLRSAQHKYVPLPSSIPVSQYQHWPGSTGESMRLADPRRGIPRSYLPRGISWPSPYYASSPQREIEAHRLADRVPGRGVEFENREVREGGRTSYASQSSGRGSAGIFRQSLSITPTLLSSPETTEETERHQIEMELPHKRGKRRTTSVDESYEWDSADACADSEVLEVTVFDQPHVGFRKAGGEMVCGQTRCTGGLQDQPRKGPSPSVSPPASNPACCRYSRSLSEARFNTLRQEYREYRRAQESVCSREPRLAPGPDSDSDANSALL